LNARASIALAATLQVLGDHLSRSPKLAACQQDEAENQVAGGDIDGIGREVNARAALSASKYRHKVMLYQLVMAGVYIRDMC